MQEENLYTIIAEDLNLKLIQVRNTIEMLDQKNTVPFIARYRKEKTGSLDEETIRQIEEKIRYLRALQARKETILRTIQSQGKLTDQLKEQIEQTFKLQELEDLYMPYRPKKKTRATIARQRGLEPLAQLILSQKIERGEPAEVCVGFIAPDKEVHSADQALSGACDIIAEIISEDAPLKKDLRELTLQKGFIQSSLRKGKENRDLEMYYDYRELISRIPAHRILAINRGEKESVLRVNIDIDPDLVMSVIERHYIKNTRSIFHDILLQVIKDSYNRLIAPSIQREIRQQLTEVAENHATEIFAVNLKNLLLQPPVRDKRIIGIDPGFRSGCKIAVIDETGKYLEGDTIFPHPPQKKYFEAKTRLRKMILDYQIDLIAIGNGTASRETELMVAELIKEVRDEHPLAYLVVSEAGASVYSASDIARDEFPGLEASMRGNISIARRLQDPLSELVKIDPRSIGVGLYQHDINNKVLSDALHNVVESCVNLVGIDLNTASKSLLMYISGFNKRIAENIVHHREMNGPFRSREQLKAVDGLGPTAYQQSAGFLRISNGDNDLDYTSIHPESYPIAERLLKTFYISNLKTDGKSIRSKMKQSNQTSEELARKLNCGLPTLIDILDNLEKPGRDPRDELPKPIFRQDVLKMEDLKQGMILKGTIRNVVDFGAFVDIGVKQDGLIHISNMATKYIKSPLEIVQVGDIVDVQVVSVDLARERIALSLKINSDVKQV